MRIAIIGGAGVMGSALHKILKKHFEVSVIDRGATQRVYSQAVSAAVIILAVKPKDVPIVAKQLSGKVSAASMIFSIAAGVKIKTLSKLLAHRKVVRMMPNLGLAVGQGITAWKSSGLNASEKNKARSILNFISENFEVADESVLDKVTAISGSGPAYFFLLARGLEKAALRLGLSKAQSRRLTAKTLSAAAVLQRSKDYEILIKQVASKGGTTEAALLVFGKAGTEQIINRAVQSAYRRAKVLGK